MLTLACSSLGSFLNNKTAKTTAASAMLFAVIMIYVNEEEDEDENMINAGSTAEEEADS